MTNSSAAFNRGNDLSNTVQKNNGIVLQTKNLSYSYPDSELKVIDDVNIKIKQGEFVLLCGSSGSGKTTLARGCQEFCVFRLTNRI